jgi:hypothetical protein
MVYTGCLNVKKFSNYNLSNALTMPNNEDCASIVCNYLTRTTAKQVCHKCQNKHHTLWHLDSQTQATNNGSSTKNNQSVNTKGVTSANVNTHHTLKGKSKNHTLLATAIVEVRNKSGQYIPCRALLDSGSQSYFITERCAQRLRLPCKQTHT